MLKNAKNSSNKNKLINDAENFVLKNLPALLLAVYPAGTKSTNEFRIGDLAGNPGSSLSICLQGPKAGIWIDHATGESGGILKLLAARFGLAMLNVDAILTKAKQHLQSADGNSPAHAVLPTPTHFAAEWDYLGVCGEYLYSVRRFEDASGNKTIRPFNKASSKYEVAPDPRPLFNLPGIVNADSVILVEGEKCAQALIDMGLSATTSMMGAKAPTSKTDWSPLKGRSIRIWPDNDDPGMHYARNAAQAALASGASECIILAIPVGKPKGWDVADAIAEDPNFDLTSYLQEALKNGQAVSADPVTPNNPVSTEVDSVVAQLNCHHAVINIGGQTLVMTECVNHKDEKEVVFGEFSHLKTRYANQRIIMQNWQGKDQEVCIADVWMKHQARRTYSGIVFAPQGAPAGYYNLFDGFAVKPAQGDCSLYLNHLLENICRGNQEFYEYLMNWMAHAIQSPNVLPGVAIVFRGSQGTGKGVATEEFGKLFGRHYIVFTSMAPLIGRFNGHLSDKLLVYVNEAVWGGDKSAEGQLKAMITDSHATVEQKFKDVTRVDSYKRLMFSSNEDWAVPVGKDDRRYFILDVGSVHKEDTEYFAQIDQQMRNGGSEALMYELLHRDLTGFNVRKIPQTPYSFELKLLSMDSADQFMYEYLRNASSSTWDIYTVKKVLHQEYISCCESVGKKHKHTASVFGKRLKKLLPSVDESRMMVSSHGETEKRVWHYVFPNLDVCRSEFEKSCKSDSEIWSL